jgi:hypothetical protein
MTAHLSHLVFSAKLLFYSQNDSLSFKLLLRPKSSEVIFSLSSVDSFLRLLLLLAFFAFLCDSNCILLINEIEECGYVCLNVCGRRKKRAKVGSFKAHWEKVEVRIIWTTTVNSQNSQPFPIGTQVMSLRFKMYNSIPVAFVSESLNIDWIRRIR